MTQIESLGHTVTTVSSGESQAAIDSAAVLTSGTRTGSTERFDGALDDSRIHNRWPGFDEFSEHNDAASGQPRMKRWKEIANR